MEDTPSSSEPFEERPPERRLTQDGRPTWKPPKAPQDQDKKASPQADTPKPSESESK